MAQETVQGADILMVQTISGLLPYNEGTQMKGQFYRRYNYKGKVFISNDETFYNELEAGGVERLALDSNEEGKLSLVGFVTYKKLIGQKRNAIQLEAISVEDFKPNKVTSTKELEELAN